MTRILNPVSVGQMLLSEIERRREAPEARRAEIAALRGGVARLDGELTRLADAIAAGGELKALTTAMQGRQRQRDETAARREHLRGQEQAGEDFDVGVWVEQTREILNDLADTLEGSPAAGADGPARAPSDTDHRVTCAQ